MAATKVVEFKERRSNPIERCPNEIRDKIAYASMRLLVKRLIMQNKARQAGSILLRKCVNLFITLIIIGSILNAVFLVFGCTLKIRPIGKAEGYGVEFVLSKNDVQKEFNRNLDLIIFESEIE